MHYSGAVYRPPSEARSLIVQCTLGCSHNKCAFCTMYKDKKFSINPIEQVLSDLDEARAYGRYIEKIFLADGDALILPMDYLLTVLDYIRDHFEGGSRVPVWRDRLVKHTQEKSIAEMSPDSFDIFNNAQVGHANIAIASSGIIGSGPGNSVQRDFLSQAYSDFIYAIIVEELGLIGAVFVVLLYIVLLFRVSYIAKRCDNSCFPPFLAMGLALLLGCQAMVNMLVAAAHLARRNVNAHQLRVHRHDSQRQPSCKETGQAASHGGCYRN